VKKIQQYELLIQVSNRPRSLVGICIVLAHWTNSRWVDMSPQSDTFFWFRA